MFDPRLFDYERAVAYLDSHIGRGVVPGLSRIKGLLELMGHPEASYPIIHIAGTNGKTSTSRMATTLLMAHGLTTGTFISPHLQRVEERFHVNGFPLIEEDFVQAVADVAAFADIYEQRSGEALTYFELTAAMAFSWFADQAVATGIIEVGLGGRLDATNAAHAEVAVLTGVGLDHTEYLGSTVEEIATEKLDILEEEAVLVSGPLVPDLVRLANRAAAAKGAKHRHYGEDFRVEGSAPAVGGWTLDIEGVFDRYEDLYLPVHGRHQTINLAVAIASVESLLERGLDEEAVREAVSVVVSPGRMEPVAADPLVLLDGAHNADGFRALGSSLREEFPSHSWVLVFSAMADKDVEGMLEAVESRVTHVIVTSIDSPRAPAAEDLADRVGERMTVPVEAIADNAAALARAREVAGSSGAVLVAGSLYLVGAVRSLELGGGAVHRNER